MVVKKYIFFVEFQELTKAEKLNGVVALYVILKRKEKEFKFNFKPTMEKVQRLKIEN